MTPSIKAVSLDGFYSNSYDHQKGLNQLSINAVLTLSTPLSSGVAFPFTITHEDLAHLDAVIEFNVLEAETTNYDRDTQHYCRVGSLAACSFQWEYPGNADPRLIDHLVYEWFPAKLNSEDQAVWRQLLDDATDTEELAHQIADAIRNSVCEQWESTPLAKLSNVEVFAFSGSSLIEALRNGSELVIPDYVAYNFTS